MNVSRKVPVFLKFTLKSLRIRSGLSQEKAAEKLGISRDTLRRWERDSGNLDIKSIDNLCRLYKVPRDYIFFGRDTALSVILKKEEVS